MFALPIVHTLLRTDTPYNSPRIINSNPTLNQRPCGIAFHQLYLLTGAAFPLIIEWILENPLNADQKQQYGVRSAIQHREDQDRRRTAHLRCALVLFRSAKFGNCFDLQLYVLRFLIDLVLSGHDCRARTTVDPWIRGPHAS